MGYLIRPCSIALTPGSSFFNPAFIIYQYIPLRRKFLMRTNYPDVVGNILPSYNYLPDSLIASRHAKSIRHSSQTGCSLNLRGCLRKNACNRSHPPGTSSITDALQHSSTRFDGFFVSSEYHSSSTTCRTLSDGYCHVNQTNSNFGTRAGRLEELAGIANCSGACSAGLPARTIAWQRSTCLFDLRRLPIRARSFHGCLRK